MIMQEIGLHNSYFRDASALRTKSKLIPSVSCNLELTAFFALYAIICFFAVWIDFLYSADGAFIAFTIASGHSWETLFSEFPRRLGALGLTGLPAALAQLGGASPWWTGKIYQSSFYAIPILSLFALRGAVPKEELGSWLFLAIVSLASFGMATFGFPTETWVTVSFLWPALASIAYPQTSWAQKGSAVAVAFIFLFSHEGAVLFAPAFLVVLLKTWRTDGQAFRYFLTCLYLLLGLAWIFTFPFLPPHNPLLARALADNQEQLWSLYFLNIPAVGLGLSVFVFVTLSGFIKAPGRWFFRVAILAIGAFEAYRCIRDGAPLDERYIARTAVVLVLPAFVFAQMLYGRFRSPGRWVILYAAITQAIMIFFSFYNWVSYKDFLLEKAAVQSHQISLEDWKDLLSKSLPGKQSYYWDWTTPYAQIMLNKPGSNVALIINRNAWYAPLTCTDASITIKRSTLLSASVAHVLLSDVCRKNPI